MALQLHPQADACGKVIIAGEHAVVYGVPALAAGLPDSLRLRATPLEDARAPIRLRIPRWDLDIELDAPTEHPVARACLEVLSWCDGPITGWQIEGESSLPARAGLGSSAALTVAVARLALGPGADIQTVVDASMAGERVFHGEPSGIDSEVAARGGVLRFARGQGVEPIPVPRPVPLCIVPSNVPRSTATQVAKVRARHDRLPTLIHPTLALMGHAVALAEAAINAGNFQELGEILTVSHGLLMAVDVSSPILDALCSAAREAGALGAKLTGAGGGGCILAVPPEPATPLLDALRERGYEPLLVRVG